MKYIHINDEKYSLLITIDYFKHILGGIPSTYAKTFLKLLLYDAHQHLTISLATMNKKWLCLDIQEISYNLGDINIINIFTQIAR